MITNAATHQYQIPRCCQVTGYGDAFGYHPNTGGGNKNTVAFAFFHHLGIAGDHRYASIPRRCRHADNNAFQIFDGKTFFKNKTRGKVEGFGAGHGYVVKCAMN